MSHGPLSLARVLEELDPSHSIEEALAGARHLPSLSRWIQRERSRLEGLSAPGSPGHLPGEEDVAGCDEVGRGPLAGPLVAAGVSFRGLPWIPGLRDSKKLRALERERLQRWILAKARSWSLEVIPVEALNEPQANLHRLSLGAMRACALRLCPPPDQVLVDGAFPLPDLPLAQRALTQGDARALPVAAASVLAKLHRDQLMRALDLEYPGYGFAEHKGYGTEAHLRALDLLGPAPPHRRHFAPVRERLPRGHEPLWLDWSEEEKPEGKGIDLRPASGRALGAEGGDRKETAP